MRFSLLVTALYLGSVCPAGTIIYGDFGPSQAFDATLGWCVSGPTTANCGPLTYRWIAAPFTPGASYTLSQIDIALANFTGTTGAVVKLTNSVGGHPGSTILESWTLNSLPVWNLSPFAPVTLGAVGSVSLLSGNQYFVVAQGLAADSLDIWGNNTQGATGALLSLDQGASWIVPGAGTLSAFDIQGTAVPEPTSAILLVLPLMALLLRNKRRD